MLQKTVLVAESDVEWREICQRRLVASGFTVITAIDGLTCLMKLKTHWPDVLVMDLDMLWGGADGVLSWVREQPARRSEPVLVVTGRSVPEAMSARTGVASSHCLQKPFHLEHLLDLCAAQRPTAEAQTAGDTSFRKHIMTKETPP
ncbi:MAG: response regulator [Pirellulaceae bacterium]|nr:response regulator [Pirellulaceae bacterium]